MSGETLEFHLVRTEQKNLQMRIFFLKQMLPGCTMKVLLVRRLRFNQAVGIVNVILVTE